MNYFHDITVEHKPNDRNQTETFEALETPKQGVKTAEKIQSCEILHNKIRSQIFQLFKHQLLKGKLKVQNFDSLDSIQAVLYHKINNINIHQTIKINFGSQYPQKAPTLSIIQCSLQKINSTYVIPAFLLQHDLLSSQFWHQEIKLCDILSKIYEVIDDYHRSEILRIENMDNINFETNKQEEDDPNQERESEEDNEPVQKRYRRKSSYMNGCADKELTETKNLNRHFRSKLRQVLRDLTAINSEERPEDSKFIDQIFTPNRVGFEDIRKALQNRWFNEGVRRQMSSGQFLHKILRGMMGIKSKKLMIKYYHVMVSAVEQPSCFIRWKYD